MLSDADFALIMTVMMMMSVVVMIATPKSVMVIKNIDNNVNRFVEFMRMI